MPTLPILPTLPTLPINPIQPLQEFYHCDAVFQHRRPKTRYLGGVLDGFHPFDGRFLLYLFTGNDLVESVVHLVGVYQNVILKVVLQSTGDVLVVVHLDTLILQVSRDCRCQFYLINIERDVLRRNQQVTDKNGIAVDIRPSQVQRPGNIVEGRHQHAVGVFLTQGLADADNLLMTTLASILQRIYLHLMIGDSGTVVPNLAQGVEVGTKREATLLP